MKRPRAPEASKLLGAAYDNSSWVLPQPAYKVIQKIVTFGPIVAANRIRRQHPVMDYGPTVLAQAKEKLR